MSNGRPGRHKRTGTTIKVRVSQHVKDVYLPLLMKQYRLDRAAVGGIVLDAAAEAQLLVAPEPPAN